MARELPPHIWFVRSNGGSGSYPVKPEGWRVVRSFLVGVLAAVLLTIGLSFTSWLWLWIPVFAVWMGYSAWTLIATARKHTDYSMTYNDYMKDREKAV